MIIGTPRIYPTKSAVLCHSIFLTEELKNTPQFLQKIDHGGDELLVVMVVLKLYVVTHCFHETRV